MSPSTRVRPPDRAMRPAVAKSSAHSDSTAPLRLRPVSTQTCTAGTSESAAAASWDTLETAGVTSYCAARRKSSSGACSHERIRTPSSIPARRSAMPSSTSATPSHSAPASTKARAAWSAPWPYAFAFTTAITPAGATRSDTVT